MLELGEMSNTLHSKVGESFKNLNFDYLFTYGDYAKIYMNQVNSILMKIKQNGLIVKRKCYKI